MFSNFLKRNELSKLQILARAMNEPYLSVEYLADVLDYTERTINRQINELNQDLIQVFGADFSVKLANRSLVFTAAQQTYPVEMITKKIYRYYLDQSLVFQLFDHVFIQNNRNILSISFIMNISQSHCYQLIKLINKQLFPYELELNLQNFILSLRGPEVKINYFLLCVIDAYYKLHDQSPSEHLIKTKRDPFNHNPRVSEKNSFVLICQVFERQQNQLESIALDSPAITELLAYILEKNNYFRSDCFPTQESMIAYNLYLRLFIPSIDNCSLRCKFGRHFLKFGHNPIIQAFKKIIHDLEQFFLNHPDLGFYLPNQEEMCYLFVIHTSYIGLLDRDLASFLKEDYTQIILDFSPSNVSKITLLIESIMEKYSSIFAEWPQSTRQAWTHHLTKVICSIVLPLVQPKIRICLQTFSCFSGESALKKQILNYFSPNLIEYVETYEQADLIISDQEISNTLAIPHIFIFDNYSNSVWIDVLQRIVSESHRKLISYVDDYMTCRAH